MPYITSAGAFSPFKQFVYFFTLTLAIQAFHMVEHIAQVMQKFLFHMANAHGLIGQLDLEQVHFAFNLLYLGTLIYVMLGWFNFGGQVCRNHKLFASILVSTVVVQSYHMIEHSVKLVQFISTGVQGTPGILGGHFDGVIFHALMNTAVFVPVAVVFFCSGLYKELNFKLSWRD